MTTCCVNVLCVYGSFHFLLVLLVLFGFGRYAPLCCFAIDVCVYMRVLLASFFVQTVYSGTCGGGNGVGFTKPLHFRVPLSITIYIRGCPTVFFSFFWNKEGGTWLYFICTTRISSDPNDSRPDASSTPTTYGNIYHRGGRGGRGTQFV